MKIGCFGAFNFNNYGDILLGDINVEYFSAFYNSSDVLLFSPDYENKLIYSEANTISASTVAEHQLDAVVVGGGDVLLLAPTGEKLDDVNSVFSASQWNWMLPAVFAKVQNLPLVINAPGVPYEFTESEKKIIRYLHGENSYVTARDPISAGYLSDALERDIPVVPDPAFLLPEIYYEKKLSDVREPLLESAGILTDKPYVCIQCSPGFLGKNGSRFLESVIEVAGSLNIQLLMIPICYLWGDMEACQEAAAASPLVKTVNRRLTVEETAALINGSQWFAGSSLHGCLTAMAFGKPALLIAFNELTKFSGAAALYNNALVKCSDWDDLVNSFYAVDKINPSTVKDMAASCRITVKEHFKKAEEFILSNNSDKLENNFTYDRLSGELEISDNILMRLLNTQQLHYLRTKVQQQANHQEWMRNVMEGARQDLDRLSVKGCLSAKDISSVVGNIDMAGARQLSGWFDNYNETSVDEVVDIADTVIDEVMVSIIVPAYNCWELTKACVDSIRKNTFHKYELILIDDASDADTAVKMQALEDDITTVIRNEQRCSFSINNNKAARIAKGNAVCLLNNDTLVTPGWLAPMVKVLEKYDNVGVVGNKHLFPDSEKLHHCGMAFDENDYPWHLHPHTDPDAPSVNYEREVSCVTFACVLIGMDHYREVDGLDEEFKNGFEDCDFCLRTTSANKKIIYTPASVIYHYGQASEGRTDHNDANWQLFESRWKGKVKNDFADITKSDKAYNKKTDKVKSRQSSDKNGIHFAIDFSCGGAFSWATADLVAALVKREENVSVTPSLRLPGIGHEHHALLRKTMKKKPYTDFQVKWSHYWNRHMKIPLAGDVNAEFFCTNYRYTKTARQLDLWMRHVQVTDRRWMPISGFNRDALLDVGIDDAKCGIVPLGYAPEVELVLPNGEQRSSSSAKLNLLLITNSEDLERYGTDVAINAFGKAFKKSDSVLLHIKDYGAHTGSVQLKQWIADQPEFPEIRWHNTFLDKKELMELYASMDALVAPFRGEGFGMKVIDAMALGVPVLMPLFGGPVEYTVADGYIPLDFKQVPVGDCYDTRNSYIGKGAYWCEVAEISLVEQLQSLQDRTDELILIGERAKKYVRENYSWDKAAERMMIFLRQGQSSRLSVVASRRKPASCPMTVIIPTLDRNDVLAKTLDAYKLQNISADKYEILLVNDHGDIDAVKNVADKHAEGINVEVIDNKGQSGPAAARNLAIEESAGDVVLITGDDIIPEKHFLSEHLRIHEKHPAEDAACLGQTLWHPELPMTPFMQHLSGAGGQQFNYRGASHGKQVSFDRFYTSNVSLKRSFLIEEESLFRTVFRFAAYEDVELAYRLHLRGMKLLYCENAVGFHHHEMTPGSFVSRQKRTGQMLTLLSLIQPSYVPDEHTVFLKSLEFARSDNEAHSFIKKAAYLNGHQQCVINSLSELLLQSMASLTALNKDGRTGIRATDAYKHSEWLTGGTGIVWDAINELILREGMAEEWAEGGDDAEWAKSWVRMVVLRSIFRGNSSSFVSLLHPPESILDNIAGMHKMYVLLQKLKTMPGLGALLDRLERTRLADMAKMALRR